MKNASLPGDQIAYSDETRLAERAAASPEAFGALFDRYFTPVYNYIRYRSGDAALTDDLTAQVFEQALRKIHTFDPQRGVFAAWLFGIARNTVNAHLRSAPWKRLLPAQTLAHLPSRDASPEEIVGQRERYRHLLDAVRELGERERELIGLRYGAQLTNRAIAGMTGMTESHVGVILYRALQKLRARLSGDPEDIFNG